VVSYLDRVICEDNLYETVEISIYGIWNLCHKGGTYLWNSVILYSFYSLSHFHYV